MTAASDLITDALNELGVYAAGEPVSAADLSQGLTCLNKLLDAWEDERLTVDSVVAININVSSGTAVYQFATPSTLRILSGPGAASFSVGPTSVDVISAVEWNSIYSVAPGAGTPTKAFFDGGFPSASVYLAPTPNANGTLTISGLYPITTFAATSTAYTLGPGGQDALTHNLAIALKPYFAVGQLSPEILMLAQETKNFLRYSNRNSRALLGRDRKVALPKQAAPGEGAIG